MTTAFNLCSTSNWVTFTVGKSKVQWESAVYRDSCDKVQITRLSESGGKPFFLGMRYKQRYIHPDTIVNVRLQEDQESLK